MEQIKPFVITVSRQLGSGGTYVGQALAKKLNIFYADREIIFKAAEQLALLEEDLESRDEKVLSFWQSFLQISAYVPDIYTPQNIMVPTDQELFQTEASIIERIAKERAAVIIGRCGFHILRDYPNHISVFLHGNTAFRTERIQKQLHVSKETAGKMITQNDKDRAVYCKTLTGKEWADARNYDISIDTGKIAADQAIELILNYLKFRAAV